jgi:2-polyprenyl-6-methoxyphenol hydroxylase-like FAD-dependent oxidoreductase
MSADPGIVVVGAGPTGLTLACELHRLGVSCRVIDKRSGPVEVSRALGMFTRSLEVLDDFGAAEDAIARGHRIEIANIYSRGRHIGGFLSASLTGTQYPRILALPQYETETLLLEHLQRLGGHVEREQSLRELRADPGGVTLTLDGSAGEQTLRARWIVGADGAHSAVRKGLGIDFAGRATRDVFVIVDAEVESGPARGEVHYYFSPEGLMVVIPLPDGAYRFAGSMPGFVGDGSPLSPNFVQGMLDRRVGGGISLRELRDAGWGAAQVRVHTRIADTFRAGRGILAGDAAHIYSPIGGRGMNGGIQDAHNLAWKLALVSTGKASEALLDSYAIERRAVARAALRATAGQMRLGTIAPRGIVALRDKTIAALHRAGALDRHLAPEAVGLRIRYRRSPGIAANGWRGPQGKRIADTPLDGFPTHSSQMLFELLREQPFSVLALAGATERVRVQELATAVQARYGELVAVHRVAREGELVAIDGVARAADAPGADAHAALVDRGGQLHEHLRVKEPSVCLVRADAHVAFFGPLGDRAALLAQLGRMLRPRAGSRPAR